MEAIKLYREETHCTLQEAVNHINNLKKTLNIPNDPEKSNVIPLWKIVSGLVAIVLVIYLLFPSKKTVQTEIVYNSEWDGSVSQVQDYLRSHLKDYDSYQAIEWSKVTKVDAPQWKYAVRHKYRARNSFGGYMIENYIFYLDEKGAVVSIRAVVDK